MGQEDDSIFEDEKAIKEGVRAAWGGEGAPERLRDRVTMAMAMEVEAGPRPARGKLWWSLAAAAVVAIGVGVGWYELADGTMAIPAVAVTYPQPKASLLSLLVEQHNDFMGGVGEGKTPEEAAREMGGRMGHEVWGPDLGKMGWEFKGARAYGVLGTAAVSMLFTKGDEAVTVFTVPVYLQQCPGTVPGLTKETDQVMQSRAVASFIGLDDELHGMVGSKGAGAMSIGELAGLVAEMRKAYPNGCGG